MTDYGLRLRPIESHYQRSLFIAEVCVFPAPGVAPRGGLHAVVVPDLAVMRQRRMVNVRELIRFELESLSVSLPQEHRIVAFDVLLEPLPRASDGEPDRPRIVDRYSSGRLRARPASSATELDPHMAHVVAAVKQFVPSDVTVAPESNLELDLDLDSIARVELLASLEQQFGMRLPDAVWQSALTVEEIADALPGVPAAGDATAPPWPLLLEVPAPAADLRALLKRRTATVVLVFMLVRAVLRPLIGLRVRGVEHLPRHGPFIISPNHQSYIDPLVLEASLPFAVFRQLFFVGASEYFEHPVAAWLARKLNIVPVDPDANLIRAMQAGAFGLRHGKVLVLFPEGERSIDGRVKSFRKGAAILSQHLRVPIVPVAVNGVFDVWPRNRPFEWRRLLPLSGHRTSLRFGAPLPPPSAGASPAAHTARLRAAVEQLWLAAESERTVD